MIANARVVLEKRTRAGLPIPADQPSGANRAPES
jgi:hypothetical protein